MAWVLAAALSELRERMAAVPQPAGVGRLRGLDVRNDLGGVLVHRHGAGLRYVTRPGEAADCQVLLWSVVARAARAGCPPTISPPYFVAGAVYSGFAMVLTLAIPIRKFYHLEDLVTLRHLDNMSKVMLATGTIVAYGYGMEVFMAWYSASHWEFFMMWNRMFGPMGWSYWMLILTNIAIPLTTLWSRKLRVSPGYLFFLSFVVNTGMWFERFVIVVTSLYRDYLPSSWGTFRATKWDYGLFIGTWGFFTTLFLLFARLAPMIPMSEIRMMLPQTRVRPRGQPADRGVEEAL